jgi:uncharacterized membrane protein
MTSVVTVATDVDAPPERVWKVVSDPNNLPSWDRHIVKVEGVRKGGVRQGDEYTTEVKFLGARAHSRQRVIELEPNRYSKVRLDGIVDGVVETWLEPLNGGRTRLKHRVEYRFKGGPLGEVVARGIQMLGAGSLLKRGVEAQKRQAEASNG